MAARARTRPVPRSIERHVLDNGVKVWTESVPRSTSVALGVWVNAGSRYEELNDSGSTHLIQRAALLGTQNKSAAQISRAIAAIGGDVSVLTERDHAGYLARVEPADMRKALDLLAELSLRPTLERAAIAAEQKEILEELRTAEEDPDFNLERMFLRSIWKGRGLCRPPAGRLLTFKGQTKLIDFKPRSLQRLHRESHHPKAITVTLSGKLDHAQAQGCASKLFGELETPQRTASTLSPTSHRFLALRNRVEFPGVRMMLGMPACGAADPSRHAAGLLDALLGSSPDSRLARRIRGNRLPAQQAESQLLMFADVGALTIRLRAEHKSTPDVLEKAVAELKALTTQPVDAKELKQARTFYKTTQLAALSSTTERIRDMARQERYFAEVLDPEKEFGLIDRVTPEQIRQLASAWIAPHTLSLAALGELGDGAIKPEMLRW